MALKENPVLLPENIVKRAKELGSALLADGMKGLGFEMEGCMEAAIMPLDMGMRMAGTAITVETSDGDNFPIHLATYSGGEGYVMVIDGKACEHTAYFGGLISGAAKAIGYEGIVCDGYVRDKDDCIAMGFPPPIYTLPILTILLILTYQFPYVAESYQNSKTQEQNYAYRMNDTLDLR